MSTWADLRSLREQGFAPSRFVVVAAQPLPAAAHALLDGQLVVEHTPGEPFPAELLEGLKVMLVLGSCDRSSAVIRAMQGKGVKLAWLGTWCPCFQRLDEQPVRCEVAREWH